MCGEILLAFAAVFASSMCELLTYTLFSTSGHDAVQNWRGSLTT